MALNRSFPIGLPFSYLYEDIISAWIHGAPSICNCPSRNKPSVPPIQRRRRSRIWRCGNHSSKLHLRVTASRQPFRSPVARSLCSKSSRNPLEREGTAIFTGTTAAIRGNAITSAFAAGKFGVRAFSQSLVKESGKENKHVAYVSLRLS